MRALATVALCLLLGGCATFGGGSPDPYGIYDIVTVNGEKLPFQGFTEGSLDLARDGTVRSRMINQNSPEPMTGTGLNRPGFAGDSIV